MGKSAKELVNQHLRETGKELDETGHKRCEKLAEALMRMDQDIESAKPTVNNCVRYAEKIVPKEYQLSHQTLYNNAELKDMMHWYINRKKSGKTAKDCHEDDSDLKEIIRRQRKQIQGLVATQQSFDSISADYYKAKIDSIRNRILFRRAMAVLKRLGKDHEINPYVSNEEIGIESPKLREYMNLYSNYFEYDNSSFIEEQDDIEHDK